jgi:hypothetical protein
MIMNNKALLHDQLQPPLTLFEVQTALRFQTPSTFVLLSQWYIKLHTHTKQQNNFFLFNHGSIYTIPKISCGKTE